MTSKIKVTDLLNSISLITSSSKKKETKLKEKRGILRQCSYNSGILKNVQEI